MIQRNSEALRERVTLAAADVKTAFGRFGSACRGLVPTVTFHSLRTDAHVSEDAPPTVSLEFVLEVEFGSKEQVIDDLRDAFERAIKTLPVRNEVLAESFRHPEIDEES